MLNSKEIIEVKKNLFPLIRDIVENQPDFPWHRDRSGVVTANRFNSSQALAVDFFGTVNKLESRDKIVNKWMKALGLAFLGPWSVSLEVLIPKSLLNEKRPTQVDAVVKGKTGIVLFECKFTEQDGGSCSQPSPLRKGLHKGIRQCNGNYEMQINPVNKKESHCALTGKGIRYWEVIPEVVNIDSSIDYRPCPFAGGKFQWMRNLVAARVLGQSLDVPSAFIVVYAEGRHPMAEKVKQPEWAQFGDDVEDHEVPLRAVPYQHLLELAIKETTSGDQSVLKNLQDWMMDKMKRGEVKS